MSLLRDDLPKAAAFTVSQAPCRAKLDQNEAPAEMDARLKEAVLEAVKRSPWHRYPQPAAYVEAKERFAAAVGFPAENLVLLAGGDQAILTAFWAAGGAGRSALLFTPTYPMFEHYARVTCTRSVTVNLGPDFLVKPSALNRDADLICLVNPNNPTGNLQEEEVVDAAVETGRFVFVDEAYYDFSGVTRAREATETENLFVGRSLSKLALAGVRCGFGVATAENVRRFEVLHFVPYNLNALHLALFSSYGDLLPHLRSIAASVVGERERLRGVLSRLGLIVYPSAANFLLFAHEEADRLYDALIALGVRLRNVSRLPGLAGHLRVTVGSREENEAFLEALAFSL